MAENIHVLKMKKNMVKWKLKIVINVREILKFFWQLLLEY